MEQNALLMLSQSQKFHQSCGQKNESEKNLNLINIWRQSKTDFDVMNFYWELVRHVKIWRWILLDIWKVFSGKLSCQDEVVQTESTPTEGILVYIWIVSSSFRKLLSRQKLNLMRLRPWNNIKYLFVHSFVHPSILPLSCFIWHLRLSLSAGSSCS